MQAKKLRSLYLSSFLAIILAMKTADLMNVGSDHAYTSAKDFPQLPHDII